MEEQIYQFEHEFLSIFACKGLGTVKTVRRRKGFIHSWGSLNQGTDGMHCSSVPSQTAFVELVHLEKEKVISRSQFLLNL